MHPFHLILMIGHVNYGELPDTGIGAEFEFIMY